MKIAAKVRARKKLVRPLRKSLRVERLELRQLMAADTGLIQQNRFDPEDVNDDGQCTPVDAVMVMNAVQGRNQAGPAQGFVDVNGDGANTPLDVVQVVNRLNRPSQPPEGAPPAGQQRPQPPQPPAGPRTFDGSGNNLQNSDWGQAGENFLRDTPARYGDGISTPAGADRKSAREISNLVLDQDESIPNRDNWSDLLWQWGQFMDHDLDLTLSATPAESFPISVPTGDPFFDPAGTGTKTISLNRSMFDTTTGDAVGDPRQQVNSISAYIDGSMVYGSSETTANSLRTFSGGLMKTSEGNLLPFSETQPGFFVAGDIRVNEQIGLIAMHTLWVREHNRIAGEIAQRDPTLTDEQVFQRARARVIGEIQAITYNEFLPALIGREAIRPYQGYRANVNAGVSNVFATAAYRVGHTMLSSEILRLDNDGNVIPDGNITLRDAFFRPQEIVENGIDSTLKGMATQRGQEIDAKIIDDVRNFLFGPPGAGGFDLASLNIQRGRDHGLASYNETRTAFGLRPARSFADISSDPEVQAQLAAAYDNVNQVDVWVGGLAEDHARGASVGPLFRAVIADQFTRSRDGDRFWYQNVLRGNELQDVERTRLSDVIRRNTTITNLQPNAFRAPGPNGGGGNRPGGGGQNVIAPPPNGGGNNTPVAPPQNGGGTGGTTTPPAPPGGGGTQQPGRPGAPAGGQNTTPNSGPRRLGAGSLDFASAADEFFTGLGR